MYLLSSLVVVVMWRRKTQQRLQRAVEHFSNCFKVYIPTWDRWLHCDPCENVCDRPLMYEKGWAKKLSLIVSTCAEQVVDVTWRYCEDRKSVTSRRAAMFDEDWLAEKLRELNDAKLSQLPAQRKVLAYWWFGSAKRLTSSLCSVNEKKTPPYVKTAFALKCSVIFSCLLLKPV